MEINEINLSTITNDELLDIYSRTKECVEFLDNEIKANEVEKQ